MYDENGDRNASVSTENSTLKQVIQSYDDIFDKKCFDKLFRVSHGMYIHDEKHKEVRDLLITHYAHLSGICPHDTRHSPIVMGNRRETDQTFINNTPNMYAQIGGNSVSYAEFTHEISKKRNSSQMENPFDHIHAVVYGHIPQGLMPSVHFSENNGAPGTAWVCLDVSKANSITSDEYSFGVYCVKRGSPDMCLGRFEIGTMSNISGEEDHSGKYNYNNMARDCNNVLDENMFKYKGIIRKGDEEFTLHNKNDAGPPFKKHIIKEQIVNQQLVNQQMNGNQPMNIQQMDEQQPIGVFA